MIPLCSLIAILFPGAWSDFQREIRALDKSWKGLVPTQVTGKARPFNVAWDLCARVNRFSRKDGSVFFPLAGQTGGSHSLWRQSSHFPSLYHWYPWGRRGYCLVRVGGLSSPLSLPHWLGQWEASFMFLGWLPLIPWRWPCDHWAVVEATPAASLWYYSARTEEEGIAFLGMSFGFKCSTWSHLPLTCGCSFLRACQGWKFWPTPMLLWSHLG